MKTLRSPNRIWTVAATLVVAGGLSSTAFADLMHDIGRRERPEDTTPQGGYRMDIGNKRSTPKPTEKTASVAAEPQESSNDKSVLNNGPIPPILRQQRKEANIEGAPTEKVTPVQQLSEANPIPPILQEQRAKTEEEDEPVAEPIDPSTIPNYQPPAEEAHEPAPSAESEKVEAQPKALPPVKEVQTPAPSPLDKTPIATIKVKTRPAIVPTSRSATKVAPVAVKHQPTAPRRPKMAKTTANEDDDVWDQNDRPDELGREEDRETNCKHCKNSKHRGVVGDLRDIANSSTSGQTPFMKMMSRLAARYGHAPKLKCYRGWKNVAEHVDRSIAKYVEGSRLAINALRDLPRAGFHHDPTKCNTKGVTRVYQGPATGMSWRQTKAFMWRKYHIRATTGDYAGHIEVLGEDGLFHHFKSSSRPINDPRHFGPWRRKLVACFVK